LAFPFFFSSLPPSFFPPRTPKSPTINLSQSLSEAPLFPTRIPPPSSLSLTLLFPSSPLASFTNSPAKRVRVHRLPFSFSLFLPLFFSPPLSLETWPKTSARDTSSTRTSRSIPSFFLPPPFFSGFPPLLSSFFFQVYLWPIETWAFVTKNAGSALFFLSF